MKQPINEIKRMQQLAGLINENHKQDNVTRFDLDNKFYDNEGNIKDIEELKQIVINGVMGIIEHVADMFGTNTADKLYLFVEKVKVAKDLDTIGDLYNLIQDFLYLNTDVWTNNLGVGTKDMKHHKYGDK